ncbi:UDP-N-acetylmuramoylalanine--D-glutamate ligase [Micrococcales bacterium KH10]|nr:UDP-N-acetylmuramoylalanine--D-glutamate ligase [Micrococcales bacterium KH10]
MGGVFVTDEFNLAESHVVIAGTGVTGRAVSAALSDRVARLTTVDGTADADVQDPETLELADVDLIVASPGWPPSHPLLQRAGRYRIPVFSEVELAWRLRMPNSHTGKPARWVAVTGTNGKTTTVQMLGSILRAADVSHRVVGNIGEPVIEAVLDTDVDVLVIELSSFQLHHTYSMQADAAVILNVADDHLDWHGSFDAYLADKAKIYHGIVTACVYPVGDRAIAQAVIDADVTEGARAIGFTLGAPGPSELGLVESIIVDRAFHTDDDDPTRQRHAAELATLSDLEHLAAADGKIPSHVIKNALAAAALARAVQVPPDAVAQGLRDFSTGQHRIETVARYESVTYINDSKATNPHAALASLRSQPDHSVVWLAGGLTKGVSFDELVAACVAKLRAVVLIGVDQRELKGALDRHAPNIPVTMIDPGDTKTVMQRAVTAAHDLATPGDVVLLAPACASMDQFASYASRGDSFAAAVRSLVSVAEVD